MTTIAYKDGILVADTQLTSGDRKFRCEKLHRFASGDLFAGAGGLSDVLKLRRWVADGCPNETPEFSERADVECIWVKVDGTVLFVDQDCEPMRITDTAVSIGSGSQYAMAAMECGLSAEEAIGIAAKFDPATSLPVMTMQVRKPAPKIRANKSGR
jgi:20S proteasome alpha/beta subunit